MIDTEPDYGGISDLIVKFRVRRVNYRHDYINTTQRGIMFRGTTVSALFLTLALASLNSFAADEGEQFLADNATKAGVITTDSGLQYKVVTEGTGASPVATDLVKVHYHGTLINGEVFDSSVERGAPTSFALNQVIKGWTEGLQTMKEGGKTIFYIPSDIAYGDRAVSSIPANSTLIFEVELLKVYALNLPTSIDGVRAFKVSEMDCGKAPALPAKDADAQKYIGCAQEYFKLVNAQMEGLIKLASEGESMRDVVLNSIKQGKQDFNTQLGPAARFI